VTIYFHNVFSGIGMGGCHIHSQNLIKDFTFLGMVYMPVVQPMAGKGAGLILWLKEAFQEQRFELRGISKKDGGTLMVEFDRQDLKVSAGNEVTLKVTGQLSNGVVFEGSDTIKIMD